MIRENLGYIETQCQQAVRLQLQKTQWRSGENFDILIENESLELCNRVLDRLKANDFHILRQFQGKSKLTTYLSAIISRQAVDMVREKRGRNRQKERAAALGPLGQKVYKLVFQQGLSIVEVQKDFLHRRLPVPTDETLLSVVDKIKGAARAPADGDDIKRGYLAPADQDGDGPEVVVPDTGSDPAKLLDDKTKRERIQLVFTDLLADLSGEERLLLRMRFGFSDGDTSGKIPDIAAALNISEKAAYKRIDKTLAKCRRKLSLQGVDIHDLF